MEQIHRNWIDFCAVTLSFGFFFLVSYYLFFELRWCKREREMNEIIDSLDRDTQMQPDPTQAVLDTKTAEFRRVVFS
jgi:hypothetical protein